MDKIKELERLITQKYGNTGAVMVQKSGSVVYEYYLNDCTQQSPFHVFSVAKSILSLLIGIAIDKGYIESIDQPVLSFFPDYKVSKREKTIQKIRLRDMLTMTTPYKYLFAGPYKKYFSSEDWVKSSLDYLGGRGKIGKFCYAPIIGPDIFSGIIVKATGKSVLEFANEHLFDPLDIRIPGNIEFHSKEEQMEFYNSRTVEGWVLGSGGVHTGGWGLVLKPADMLKIGQLLINRGSWNGQQLISEKWIKESTSNKSCWKNMKYGYLWWVIDEEQKSFAALGDGGNALYVNPKEELVVVFACYFKPKAEDRIQLIKEYIEPIWKNK